MGSFDRTVGMDVDQLRGLGNGLYDHDQHPRRLYMGSRPSRRTFVMDKGRSLGAACRRIAQPQRFQSTDLSTKMKSQPSTISSVSREGGKGDNHVRQ